MKKRYRLSLLVISVFTLFTISSISWAEKEEGLVGHWNFDEGSGEVVKDQSGNKNDGKIYGAKWVKLAEGHALSFDGIDNYVDFGTRPGLCMKSEGTVELWYNAVTFEGALFSFALVQGWHEQRLTLGFNTWAKEPSLLGNLFWSLADGKLAFQNRYIGLMAKKAWTHLAITFDGKNVKIYVNGTPCEHGGLPQKVTPDFKNIQLILGKIHVDSFPDFEGMIDELRIYNYALSRQRIYRHYKLEKKLKVEGD